MKRYYISESTENTIKIGEELAKDLRPGDVIAFYGALGTGKTTMIKGVCKGFGIEKGVKSPSFVFLRIYKAKYPLYHFDFFRLKREKELINICFDDFFYNSGIVLIEWADKVKDLLPSSRYEVVMNIIGENEREILITYIPDKLNKPKKPEKPER